MKIQARTEPIWNGEPRKTFKTMNASDSELSSARLAPISMFAAHEIREEGVRQRALHLSATFESLLLKRAQMLQ